MKNFKQLIKADGLEVKYVIKETVLGDGWGVGNCFFKTH